MIKLTTTAKNDSYNSEDKGSLLRIIEIEKKSKVLKKAQFGCLRHIYAINITRGCEFQCVYCYARGYPEAPAPGQVYLYRNIPEKLASEIDNPRRRTVVDHVLFNTASDSFQPHPAILDITYRSMEILLKRKIRVSFLTKGWISDRFINLFAQTPELVTARVGLVSLDCRYRDIFEPYTAPASERIRTIEGLKKTGVSVEVRVDPIIPFFTDNERNIKELYKTLSQLKIKNIFLSYLHLRPAIEEQFERELPPGVFNILKTCFSGKDWTVVGSCTRSKLVPLPLRQRGYNRFKELAKPFGITPSICSCKNPDISGQLCSINRESHKDKSSSSKSLQLKLFP